MNTCCKRADLERLAAGLLSAEEEKAVRTHLDVCDACQQTLEACRWGEAGPSPSPVHSVMTMSASSVAAGDTSDTSPAGRLAKHLPQIEGYRIAGVLGQGGMGIVYHAVQAKLNRAVALKVLPAIVGTASPSAVARFRREATAAARLHHTNIVPIYDFGESSDSYYYAMELVHGQPLNVLIRRFAEQPIGSAGVTALRDIIHTVLMNTPADAVKAGGPIGPADDASGTITTTGSGKGRPYFRQVARWMADAADALHYAHGEGIIHRDIKPANLILSTDGRIMVADFGLAKLSNEESVTITGSLLGTLRYVSPEQAMAKRVRVDHRTDIYSLGAVMYELLCLQPAFGGDDDKEILGAIIARDPVKPRSIESHVPAELETICLKSLEKSPEARYPTARALAEDLRRFIHDLPIVAKRPGLVRRSLKYARRHKALVIGVTAVVLLSAVSLFGWRQYVHRQEATRNAEVERLNSLYDSGMYLADNDKWDAAEAKFHEAIESYPDDPRAMLGMVWMKLEYFKLHPKESNVAELEGLEQLCQRALAINPRDYTAQNYLGVILKKLRRYPEAIAAAKELTEWYPGHFPAWTNLGAFYALDRNLEEAGDCLRRGAELAETTNVGRPEDRAEAWRSLAALEHFLGEDGAADHVRQVLESSVGDVAGLVLRARIHLDRDDLENAVADARFADHLAKSKDPKTKRMLALAYLRYRRYDDAVGAARDAMELEDWPVINHLIAAVAEAGRGNPIGARDQLAAAEAVWPVELEQNGFLATYDEGILWFESYEELVRLKQQAEQVLAGPDGVSG